VPLPSPSVPVKRHLLLVPLCSPLLHCIKISTRMRNTMRRKGLLLWSLHREQRHRSEITLALYRLSKLVDAVVDMHALPLRIQLRGEIGIGIVVIWVESSSGKIKTVQTVENADFHIHFIPIERLKVPGCCFLDALSLFLRDFHVCTCQKVAPRIVNLFAGVPRI